MHSVRTMTMATVRDAECTSIVQSYTLCRPFRNTKQGFGKENNSKAPLFTLT